MLRVVSPAKVNLHLAVGAVRDDGYHDLTAVFHALELADEVRLEPTEGLALSCDSDLGVEPMDNLACRAAMALGGIVGREVHVAIHLTKRIPHGAGLGGGSSNAAAVIAGLATLWGIDPRDERCVQAAAAVGADVPFFLARSGAALMTGRGDRLEAELPALAGVPVALVRPPRPVSTLRAYQEFDASPQPPADPEATIAALRAGDPVALACALPNNLEKASFSVVPEVADALAWVRAADGVLGAAVAGSGSAVFALCATDDAALEVADGAPARGWWGAATRLRGGGVEVFSA